MTRLATIRKRVLLRSRAKCLGSRGSRKQRTQSYLRGNVARHSIWEGKNEGPASFRGCNPLLPNAGAQTSTDKFLDDSGVEHVNPSIGSKMPNSIVLGPCSRRNDRKRTWHSGRVRVLQVPLGTALPIVFGPLNWFGGNSPCRIGIVFAAHRHLADWDAYYETEITKVAEKAGIGGAGRTLC